MPKTSSKKYLEQPLDEFIRTRIEAIDVSIEIEDIRTAFDTSNLTSKAFMQLKIFVGVVSLLLMVAGLLILTNAALLSNNAIILASCLSIIGVGGVFLAFKADELKRRIFLRSSVNASGIIWRNFLEDIFEPIQSRTASLVEISPDGVGQSTTPNSGQPVSRYFSNMALDSLVFTEAIGQALNHSIKLIVISPSPRTDWYNFSLWNDKIAPHVLEAFDRTPQIYQNNNIKRIKVRVALETIIPQALTARQAKKKTGSKKPTVNLLAKNLKIKALALRQRGCITDEEEQQLCRLSLSDKQPVDAQQTSSDEGNIPESWFLRLMSGDYPKPLMHLVQTLESEYPHAFDIIK